MVSLEECFSASNDPKLTKVVLAIAASVQKISHLLKTVSTAESGTVNPLGDKQLMADLETDEVIIEILRKSGLIALGSSEEQPIDLDLGGHDFSIAWDPLDGSSIVDANWSIGSIFAIWPGKGILNRPCRDLSAACYALYGPRTLFVIASRNSSGVQEFVLTSDNEWILSRDSIKVQTSKKIFAPANARATRDNTEYRSLVGKWLDDGYTLRYTGGMVPDVHHILTKGGGVFCSPVSPSAPPKLRVLYECIPLAYIIEAAGGSSTANGMTSALELMGASHNQRSGICLGSREEVGRCDLAMQQQQQQQHTIL